MASYTQPIDTAKTALAEITAEYATANVKIHEVAYVSTGETIHDGEQLTVAVGRLYGIGAEAGAPGETVEALRCVHWRGVQLLITHLRCQPVGKTVRGEFKPPTPDEYEAVAVANVTDAEIIRTALVRATRAGAFGEGPVFALEGWAPLSNDGGLTGGVLSCRLSLV